MKDNRAIIYILKHSFFVGVFFILYLIQYSPNLLFVMGIKPNLLICMCIAISMHNDEFIGGIYGTIAGIFLDIHSSTLFGFNSILLLILCVGIGLVVIYYMKNSLKNFFLFVTGVSAVRAITIYFFDYIIWDYEYSWIILVRSFIPSIIYTVIVCPVAYFAVKRINTYFDSKIKI